MSRKLIRVILGILIIMCCICGCGEEAADVKQSVANQAQEEEITDDKVDETDTTEQTETILVDELTSSADYRLSGFWTNGTVTYYINSFEKDGEKIFYYTKSDEPDMWYRYVVTSKEDIFDDLQEQYAYTLYMLDITNSSGEKTQGKIGKITDSYMQSEYMNIEVNGTLVQLEKIDFRGGYHNAANYMKFVVAQPDENENVILSLIDLTNEKYLYLQGTIIFTDMAKGYHKLENTGYLGFHEGAIENYDDYNVVEIGYDLSMDFAFVDFPYMEGTPEEVDLPYDVFAGYVIADNLGTSYLYQAGEGQRMEEYDFTSGCMSFLINNCRFYWYALTKETYDSKILESQMDWVFSESWGEGYYDEESYEYYLQTDKGYFKMSYNPHYAKPDGTTVATVLNSLTVSEGGETLEAHIRDIVELNGHRFKDTVYLTSVTQGDYTELGIQTVTGKLSKDSSVGFTYYLWNSISFEDRKGSNEGYENGWYEDGMNVNTDYHTSIYDSGYTDEFEIMGLGSSYTKQVNRILVHIQNQPHRYLDIYSTEFESADYYVQFLDDVLEF